MESLKTNKNNRQFYESDSKKLLLKKNMFELINQLIPTFSCF